MIGNAVPTQNNMLAPFNHSARCISQTMSEVDYVSSDKKAEKVDKSYMLLAT